MSLSAHQDDPHRGRSRETWSDALPWIGTILLIAVLGGGLFLNARYREQQLIQAQVEAALAAQKAANVPMPAVLPTRPAAGHVSNATEYAAVWDQILAIDEGAAKVKAKTKAEESDAEAVNALLVRAEPLANAPDFRGWEWHHRRRPASDRMKALPRLPTEAPAALLAVAPGRTHFAVAAADGSVRFGDVTQKATAIVWTGDPVPDGGSPAGKDGVTGKAGVTGKDAATKPSARATPIRLVWNTPCTHLGVMTDDGRVRILDRSGAERFHLSVTPAKEPIRPRSGQLLAIRYGLPNHWMAAGRGLRIWDLDQGGVSLVPIPPDAVVSALTTISGDACVYAVEAGEVWIQPLQQIDGGPSPAMMRLTPPKVIQAWSVRSKLPGGRGWENEELLLWGRTAQGELLHGVVRLGHFPQSLDTCVGHASAVLSLDVMPEELFRLGFPIRLASGGADGTIVIHESGRTAPLYRFPAHTGPVVGVGWLPQQTGLLSLGRDDGLKLWRGAD